MDSVIIKDGILYTINDGMELGVSDTTLTCNMIKFVTDVGDNNVYNRTKDSWVLVDQPVPSGNILYIKSYKSDSTGCLTPPDNIEIIKCEFFNPDTNEYVLCKKENNIYKTQINKKILFWNRTITVNNADCLVYYNIKK